MKHTKYILTILLGGFLISTNATAQVDQKIYAANACQSFDNMADAPGAGEQAYVNSDGSIEPDHTGAANADMMIYCPVVRHKIGTAAGARFWAYFNRPNTGNAISCRMTSRRPHDGALVSTATSGWAAGNGPTGNILLARSIVPSTTWGHYNLRCRITGPEADARLHSYRIREY